MRGQRGEGGHPVEAFARAFPVHRHEVVEPPHPVEPELLGELGAGDHLVERHALLSYVEPEPDRHARKLPRPPSNARTGSVGFPRRASRGASSRVRRMSMTIAWAKIARHDAHCAGKEQLPAEKKLVSGAIRTDLILSAEIPVAAAHRPRHDGEQQRRASDGNGRPAPQAAPGQQDRDVDHAGQSDDADGAARCREPPVWTATVGG